MAILRLIWMITIGWMLALACFTVACLCFLTVIGIPLGLVFFWVGVRVLTFDF